MTLDVVEEQFDIQKATVPKAVPVVDPLPSRVSSKRLAQILNDLKLWVDDDLTGKKSQRDS